ncbi:MAG: substrate-binding domain-containing protein [bacterium]|nr:substrate-binding domain-containing protein [Candidatus Colisoma equi]
MKTILFFQSSFCESNQRQLAGVYAFARTVDWNVQIVEYGATAAKLRKPDLKALFSFWEPDGCIVDCGGAVTTFSLADFRRIPTVFIDRYPSTIERGAICVTSDSAAIAEVATKELLPGGFASYAYVDWFLPHEWSNERGDEFAKIMECNGKILFRHRMLRLEGKANQDDLVRWLRTLPRPCGIFAVNDRTASCVVSAALKAGLDVPHDIAVVGVDNDVMQCENSSVPITSVPLDHEGGGRVSANLLHGLMKGRKLTRGGLIGARPIVRRASSRRFADSRVSAAVEHIRLHASEGLKVDDVVRTMGCSRALAYLRFGEAVGHSILDEIHHIRLERAKGLLKAGKHSIGMVADSCGYASAVDFRRTFKRIVGKTPKAWQSQAKVC